MQNSDTFGSGLPDGFSEPEGMSAIEQAEAAIRELAEKYSKGLWRDSWLFAGINRVWFKDLDSKQQDQARSMFIDAGHYDGYRYELVSDSVLCRRREK